MAVHPVFRAGGSLQGEEGLSLPQISGFLGVIWRPAQDTVALGLLSALSLILSLLPLFSFCSVSVSVPPLCLYPTALL